PDLGEEPFFSGAERQHGFAVGVLEVLELTLVLFAYVLGLRPQGVLHPPLAVHDPALDLRRRQVELPAGLGHCRLALDDFQNQRRLPPCRPTLDLFFHHLAHRALREKVAPEQEITGSLQSGVLLHRTAAAPRTAGAGYRPGRARPRRTAARRR